MINKNWNFVEDTGIPWVLRLNQLVSEANLPALNGSTLYIVSDSSGYHRKSKYEVISLLIMDPDNSRQWERSRRHIRKHFLSDGRRLSFKGLHDQRQFSALPAFLEAANNIDGICVNIALIKKFRVRYIDKTTLQSLTGISPFRGKWSHQTLNHMFKVVHFMSLFIAGFCKPDQNVYWISDQDMIFANPDKSEDVALLLSALTDMYVKYKLGELGIGTTSLDEGNHLEDLAAIPDLCAGALSEYLAALRSMCGGKIVGGIAYPTPQGITLKTEQITSWIMDNNHKLKRLLLLFESADKNKFGLTRLEIF